MLKNLKSKSKRGRFFETKMIRDNFIQKVMKMSENELYENFTEQWKSLVDSFKEERM
jgi:hypothetical protein